MRWREEGEMSKGGDDSLLGTKKSMSSFGFEKGSLLRREQIVRNCEEKTKYINDVL